MAAAIESKPQDWRTAGAVAFDITKSGEQPAAFPVELFDEVTAAPLPPPAPHETASFALTLNSAPPTGKGMRHEPLLPGLRLSKIITPDRCRAPAEPAHPRTGRPGRQEHPAPPMLGNWILNGRREIRFYRVMVCCHRSGAATDASPRRTYLRTVW
jgi:hypothetical protein